MKHGYTEKTYDVLIKSVAAIDETKKSIRYYCDMRVAIRLEKR